MADSLEIPVQLKRCKYTESISLNWFPKNCQLGSSLSINTKIS